MKKIIQKLINASFIVFLQIFEPVHQKAKLVSFSKRFDLKDKKDKV